MNSKKGWIIRRYKAVATLATGGRCNETSNEIDAATIYVFGMRITSLHHLFLVRKVVADEWHGKNGQWRNFAVINYSRK